MTRLRDDGYLETDDAVIQACVLGKLVRRWRGGKWVKDILGSINIKHKPILIPAKTVAEVVDTGDEFSNLVLGSIGMYEHPTYTLNDWLRAHTEEKS